MERLSVWRLVLISIVFAMLASCGGKGSSSAPPTGGITSTPGNSKVVISWTQQPGVDYWMLCAPGSAPINMSASTLPAGGHWFTSVTSPYVVQTNITNGMVVTNGTPISCAVNARTSGGPGGPQSNTATATPAAGVTWNPPYNVPLITSPLPANASLNGVTAATATTGTGYFVAVGSAGAIFQSSDGLNWGSDTACDSAIGFTGASVMVNSTNTGYSFVAVGANGSATNICYSPDAINWSAASGATPSVSLNSVPLNAVASLGGMVVAVGNSGAVYYSADFAGAVWHQGTAVSGAGNLTGIVYCGACSGGLGLWVAVDGAGHIYTNSTANIEANNIASNGWTLVKTAAGALSGVTASSTAEIVAVGFGGLVVYSTDGNGAIWSSSVNLNGSAVSNLGTALNAVATDSAQFIAAGNGGAVFISSDGINWTTVSNTGTSNNLRAITGSSNRWEIVGANGTSIYSQ